MGLGRLLTGISTLTRVPVSSRSGYKSSIVTLKSVFRKGLIIFSLSSTIPIPREVLPGKLLLCAPDIFRPIPSSSTTQFRVPCFSVKKPDFYKTLAAFQTTHSVPDCIFNERLHHSRENQKFMGWIASSTTISKLNLLLLLQVCNFRVQDLNSSENDFWNRQLKYFATMYSDCYWKQFQ